MTLAEIFVRLPAGTAQHLEEILEQAIVPDSPTREQVLEVANEIATKLRFGAVNVAFEGDEQVIALIDQLPQAIVDQLF